MLKLYVRVIEYAKFDSLTREMLSRDMFDYLVPVFMDQVLSEWSAIKDTDRLESLLLRMEADPKATINLITYSIATKAYIQVGQHEKAYAMLRKSEDIIELKRRRAACESLLTMYSSMGKKTMFIVFRICVK
ncbi:hypothetical protein Ahy_A07g033317 [Arachis hypogaea]|uniref:Uncharacterized protein n=1 Tax=Arachis hypogaea TaxID=3818 RepID=A0A445C8V2_ARAHY|nr:hypothetical protein Ahy_A07g033317 [Arachis hypogaea]